MLVKISFRISILNVNITTKQIKQKLDSISKKQNVKKGKLSDSNEHNILSTSNDSDATACAKVEYPWPETYNTISSNAIDTIYDKIAFWSKYLFLLPQVRVGRSILKK